MAHRLMIKGSEGWSEYDSRLAHFRLDGRWVRLADMTEGELKQLITIVTSRNFMVDFGLTAAYVINDYIRRYRADLSALPGL